MCIHLCKKYINRQNKTAVLKQCNSVKVYTIYVNSNSVLAQVHKKNDGLHTNIIYIYTQNFANILTKKYVYKLDDHSSVQKSET